MFFLCCKFYSSSSSILNFMSKSFCCCSRRRSFILHPPCKFFFLPLQCAALLLQSFTFFFQCHPHMPPYPYTHVANHTNRLIIQYFVPDYYRRFVLMFIERFFDFVHKTLLFSFPVCAPPSLFREFPVNSSNLRNASFASLFKPVGVLTISVT